MKNSNYIAESVFKVKLNYEKMQNETEKLFFRCLEEGRDVEYFEKQIKKIWNIDHEFMINEIERYREIVRERIGYKEETLTEDSGSVFALVPISVLIGVEKIFQKIKTKEYKNSITYYKKLEKPIQKEKYIEMKLGKYTNNTVIYKSHTKGGYDRSVSPSVYNSMIYNTNLTREGWNETMKVADQVGANYFIIRYHPFSCIHCIAHQERLLTRDEIISMAGRADESSGDILHPNCKCEITMWNQDKLIPRSDFTDKQKAEFSDIRQKVNGLTLKKERLKTEMQIAKESGLNEMYDKLNQQRNKINKSIRELKEALPTESLRKQVVAINR